jgi:hypothetical protein
LKYEYDLNVFSNDSFAGDVSIKFPLGALKDLGAMGHSSSGNFFSSVARSGVALSIQSLIGQMRGGAVGNINFHVSDHDVHLTSAELFAARDSAALALGRQAAEHRGLYHRHRTPLICR